MATLNKLYLNGTAYDLAYNSTITVKKNGTSVWSFSLNQSANWDVDISVPTKTSDVQNDSGFITNTVDNLTNYYKKSETYTQAEVNALVQNFQWFEVVADLPTTDIKTNIIYLKWPIGSWADKYEEWIYSSSTWIKIWETSVDLTNYVTTNTAQTISAVKTFWAEPVLPSKTTDATNDWTKPATEAQVYKKQDKLTAQTAYTSKGSATKVPQITTNTLWQVTGITEVTITQPTVNDWTLTIKQWGTSKGTFTANQSSASTVDLNTCFLKTQVEYDALPASKATDGNFYFIYSS